MRNFRLKLGFVLVIFSLFLIFFGMYFDFDSRDKIELVAIKNDNIPATTIEDSNITSNPDSSNGSSESGSTSNNSSNNNPQIETPSTPNSNNTVNDSSTNNSNASNEIPNSTTTNNSNISSPNSTYHSADGLSIEQLNDKLRKEIENTYGILIKYGNETEGYSVGGYSVTSVNDSETIYTALNELKENMALYPNGFFQETKKGGLPLTVYFIQRYSAPNVTGITDRNQSRVIISIALDFPFADSFNHEIYHYMEHYMYSKGGGYSNWNNYNPEGFKYGEFDYKYVWEKTYSESAYFVNAYAQSYEYEDRASTFEFMMASQKINALNTGNYIWLKAKVMCETIDYYFTTVTPYTTEYWERFVY